MRSIMLILSLAGFALQLQAQITITAADMPAPGDVLQFANDTAIANLNPGVAGGNQIWDFSALDNDDQGVTFTVVPIAQAPLASQFPGANFCMLSDEVYQYGQVTADAYVGVGLALYLADTENLTPLFFDPPQTILEFPTTWESSFSSTYGIDITLSGEDFGVDSLRIRQVVEQNVVFDAYGEVILPLGTFEALRSRNYTNSNDSIFVKLFGIWQLADASTTVDSSYNWYSKTSKGGLVTVYFDANGMPSTAAYFNGINTQVQAPEANFTFEPAGNGVINFTDASLNEPTEWLWSFGDTETSTEQNPVHEYTSSGTYQVCLTVTNEAGSATVCQSVTVVVTGTNDLDNVFGVKVFPNPVLSSLNVSLNTPINGRMVIFDAEGRLLESHQFNSHNFVVPMANYTAGTYFYQLQEADGKLMYSGKVVKE